MIIDKIPNKHQLATKYGASFVIVALLENSITREKVIYYIYISIDFIQTIQELKPYLTELKKCNISGCPIIIEHLTGKRLTNKKLNNSKELKKKKNKKIKIQFLFLSINIRNNEFVV